MVGLSERKTDIKDTASNLNRQSSTPTNLERQVAGATL